MTKFNKCFLLNEVSFESDTSTKDLCITREQFIGIYDVVNDQGFLMHYRAISYTISDLGVFCESILQQSKRTDWLQLFSYVECFRSKDLSI